MESGNAVLVGGADAVTGLKIACHHQLRTVSPSDRIRPFDIARDGTAFREGAAFLLIESEGHATDRNSHALARLLGWGSATDLNSLTAPDPEGRGAISAMRAALRDSGLDAEQIDHIQAHATGTRLNDAIEARGLAGVFGAHLGSMTVSADKGAIGHTFGASGILSSIIAILALRHEIVPAAIGCLTLAPECAVPVVRSAPVKRSVRRALVNNFGFGGCNVSLVFQHEGN